MVFGTSHLVSEPMRHYVEGRVEIVRVDYAGSRLAMSDPRASGTMSECVAETQTPWVEVAGATGRGYAGGHWVIETCTVTNNGGSWVGHGLGVHVFTRNLPSGTASAPSVLEGTPDVTSIGEYHFRGEGGYQGLAMDLYTETEGVVIGSIRPIE